MLITKIIQREEKMVRINYNQYTHDYEDQVRIQVQILEI